MELTDAQGELAWAGRYQAWGKVVGEDYAAPDFEQPLRYPGQYADHSTGLHYNTFRYYDPDIGRFINQDPIGLAGGDNLYAYAPNPTGWVDPLGWCGTTLNRAMRPENGQFVKSPRSGAANSNQMGARTLSSNPKHFDMEVLRADDMVGPSFTGQSGLSASLETLPLRPGQVNATVNTKNLPPGLGTVNDHGTHVSIFPSKDMTFGEFQDLLNQVPWK